MSYFFNKKSRAGTRRVSVQTINAGPVGLTADPVDSTLDDVAGKPVVDCVLACVVQDVVELKPEAVLPVVVHPVSRGLRFMIQRSLVYGDRLRSYIHVSYHTDSERVS